jgi:hypothetical protein
MIKTVEFTVADRSGMLCPVILGRLAIQADFIVDAGAKYLLSGIQLGG